jgi:hypothetical protein
MATDLACPHLSNNPPTICYCVKDECAWWVASYSMCAIRLQAEMLARTNATMERQVREDRRTVRSSKKE